MNRKEISRKFVLLRNQFSGSFLVCNWKATHKKQSFVFAVIETLEIRATKERKDWVQAFQGVL